MKKKIKITDFPYYRRKNHKIIIEKKEKGKTIYVKTLPDADLMDKILEYVKEHKEIGLLKRRKRKCKECGVFKKKLISGFCEACIKLINNPEYRRKKEIEKKFKVSYELYKKLKEKCVLCEFNKNIEIHHLNKNHLDNSEENLIGLCSNCHKMSHSKKYEKEMIDRLKDKGYKIVFFNKEKTLKNDTNN